MKLLLWSRRPTYPSQHRRLHLQGRDPKKTTVQWIGDFGWKKATCYNELLEIANKSHTIVCGKWLVNMLRRSCTFDFVKPRWEAMRETQSLPSREPLGSFTNYSGPTEMAYGPGLPTPPLQPMVPATQPSMDSATQPAIPAIPTIPVPLVQPLQSPITPPTPPTSISFAEVPPVQPLPPVTPPQPQVVPPASSSPMSPYPNNPTPPLTLPQPVISAPSNPPSARAWEPSPRGVPDAPRWRPREAHQKWESRFYSLISIITNMFCVSILFQVSKSFKPLACTADITSSLRKIMGTNSLVPFCTTLYRTAQGGMSSRNDRVAPTQDCMT